MFTFTLLYKFKPGIAIGELQRLFSETVAPELSTVPGLITFEVHQYEGCSEDATVDCQGTTEWEWVYIEKWDSKESHDTANAIAKVNAVKPDRKITEPGFYEKFNAALEKSFGFYTTVVFVR